MNHGQEMFYNFFMERVKDDKKEEAKLLLEDSFAKQDAGTFNMEHLQKIMPEFYAIAKPEAMKEIQEAMDNFASRL